MAFFLEIRIFQEWCNCFFIIIIIIVLYLFFLQKFSGRFDTSRSMKPRLVSKISQCGGFCDGRVGAAGGIGYLVVGFDASKGFCQNDDLGSHSLNAELFQIEIFGCYLLCSFTSNLYLTRAHKKRISALIQVMKIFGKYLCISNIKFTMKGCRDKINVFWLFFQNRIQSFCMPSFKSI